MDLFANLGLGFETAFTPINLVFCFIGVLLGTLIGVLPGIGPTATIAMLLPLTLALSPATSLIMLAGIYYGAQYGGSTTAILVNLPGESSSAVTAIDGYQMARQGRAGPALAAAALGSFFAGSVATLVLVLFAPPLTAVALEFGPAEYFSLVVLGLISSVALAHGSVLKALAMIVLGLLLGLIGTDIYTGEQRFTLGQLELADGLNFVAVAVGVFGIAEILRNLENEHERDVAVRRRQRADAEPRGPAPHRGARAARHRPRLAARHPAGRRPRPGLVRRLYGGEEGLEHARALRQGRDRGGGRARIGQQRGRADLLHPDADLGHPGQPGHGSDDRRDDHPGHHPGAERRHGRAGAVLGHHRVDVGRQPAARGPQSAAHRPLGADAERSRTTSCSRRSSTFSAIGVYSINSNAFDLFAVAAFGLLGYVLVKFGCEPAPLLLGFVLGPMLEEHLRRAMIIARGDPLVFLQRPISAALLGLAVLALVIVLMPNVARKREEVFQEEE